MTFVTPAFSMLLLQSSLLIGMTADYADIKPVRQITMETKGEDFFTSFQRHLQQLPRGGELRILKGSYTLAIDKSIALPSNITIRCDEGVEVSKPKGNAAVFTTDGVSNVHVLGGHWTGPGNQAAILWRADGTRDFGMEGAKVERFATAMNVGSKVESFHFGFKNNICYRNTLTGISVSEVTDLTIRDNTFEANGEEIGATHGAYLISPRQGLITKNRFINNNCFGLHIYVAHKDKRPPQGLTITENFFSGNGVVLANGGAIIVSGVVDGIRDIQITHNRSEGDYKGIVMISSANYTVSDNEILQPRSIGMYFGEEVNSRRVIHGEVARNRVIGSKAEALQFGLSPNNTDLVISDNEFTDNARGFSVRPGYQAPGHIRIERNRFQGTRSGENIPATMKHSE